MSVRVCVCVCMQETREPPPELLMPLLPYQKQFLAWAMKQVRIVHTCLSVGQGHCGLPPWVRQHVSTLSSCLYAQVPRMGHEAGTHLAVCVVLCTAVHSKVVIAGKWRCLHGSVCSVLCHCDAKGLGAWAMKQVRSLASRLHARDR